MGVTSPLYKRASLQSEEVGEHLHAGWLFFMVVCEIRTLWCATLPPLVCGSFTGNPAAKRVAVSQRHLSSMCVMYWHWFAFHTNQFACVQKKYKTNSTWLSINIQMNYRIMNVWAEIWVHVIYIWAIFVNQSVAIYENISTFNEC